MVGQIPLACPVCQPPPARAPPQHPPHPLLGPCQKTCLLLQVHLPLVWAVSGLHSSSSRLHPLGRWRLPLGLLGVPQEALGPHKQVLSLQGHKQADRLVCRNSQERLGSKACRVALVHNRQRLVDSRRLLVDSRLALVVRQIHLGLTVGLALPLHR